MISVDPFYDPKTLLDVKLDFKKSTSNKNKDEKSTSTTDDTRAPLASRVKHVGLLKQRSNDIELYRQVVSDTLTLCEEDLISAHVSDVFELEDIDKAIEFINEKKCTGKVLIEIKEAAKKKEKELKETEEAKEKVKKSKEKSSEADD